MHRLVVHPLTMVYCRKEFLEQEVEREHGFEIARTHQGRIHHTRAVAACAKGASREAETSPACVAGKPRTASCRDCRASQGQAAHGAHSAPPLQRARVESEGRSAA